MRFANYNDNWNKSQLKNLCIFLKGNGVSKDELSKEGQPCILYGELYTTYKMSKIKEIKSRTMLDNPNLVRSKKNDVIIPCSGETAIDIATSVCIPVDNVILGGDLTIIRSNLDGEFLSNQINSVKRKAIATIAQGASIVHLHADDLKNIEIDFPTLAEQRKIADFIGVLDDRIEAQSKIINDLEFQKKGLFDKLIKQNKSLWQKVKLSSILHERKTYATKDNSYPHATLSKEGISAKTDRYDRDFLVKDEEKEYKITHLNDICYNPANLKFGVICRNTFGSAIFSPIYVTYEVSSKCNPSFIELILTNKNFLNYIRKYEQGTVYERMAVNSEDFLKGEIAIPELEEQNKITKIFTIIDDKIQIEKDTLELYKQQKTYLLRNLFI